MKRPAIAKGRRPLPCDVKTNVCTIQPINALHQGRVEFSAVRLAAGEELPCTACPHGATDGPTGGRAGSTGDGRCEALQIQPRRREPRAAPAGRAVPGARDHSPQALSLCRALAAEGALTSSLGLASCLAEGPQQSRRLVHFRRAAIASSSSSVTPHLVRISFALAMHSFGFMW